MLKHMNLWGAFYILSTVAGDPSEPVPEILLFEMLKPILPIGHRAGKIQFGGFLCPTFLSHREYFSEEGRVGGE